MKRIMFISLVLLITAVFTASGFAEPAEYRGKDSVRKRAELVRMWELTRALDLDEETASRLFPVLNKYEKEKSKIRESIKKNIRKLKEALEYGEKDRIYSTMKELRKKRREIRQLEDNNVAELREILTIEQQAKLVLLRHKFARDRGKMMAKARKHLRGMNEPEARYFE